MQTVFLYPQVLLEKLKGSSPKLCDSLVVGDVDTSTQLTTGTDSGVSSGITSLGEGREGSQVTSQGKYSLAFHQVGEFLSTFIYVIISFNDTLVKRYMVVLVSYRRWLDMCMCFLD